MSPAGSARKLTHALTSAQLAPQLSCKRAVSGCRCLLAGVTTCTPAGVRMQAALASAELGRRLTGIRVAVRNNRCRPHLLFATATRMRSVMRAGATTNCTLRCRLRAAGVRSRVVRCRRRCQCRCQCNAGRTSVQHPVHAVHEPRRQASMSAVGARAAPNNTSTLLLLGCGCGCTGAKHACVARDYQGHVDVRCVHAPHAGWLCACCCVCLEK